MTRRHAVILGWAGSTARQLRTIAAWYRERGFEPIVVVPRVFRAMAFPWGWRGEGRSLAGRVLAAVKPGDSIVVHSFSNAGFWTYAAMLRALERHPRGPTTLESIAALVLDSAPGFPEQLGAGFTARYSAMAMMPILMRALRRPPALSHPLLDPPLIAFMRLWYHLSPTQIRAAEQSLAVVGTIGAFPILALYSSADSLVPARFVEAFLDAAREHGRDVRALRWEDSEHVRHMIAHRHAYFDALAAFIATLPA
jgi:hypothetical protein